jgi:deoxycytidylate deaminase
MLFMQLDQGAFVRREARLWSNRSASERTKTSSWIVAKREVIQTGSGRLVPGSRHLVAKSSTDEMRVSRCHNDCDALAFACKRPRSDG